RPGDRQRRGDSRSRPTGRIRRTAARPNAPIRAI
ncbi:uncharacterized protein METZ01_LOCUS504171, partial [marine metagenome]